MSTKTPKNYGRSKSGVLITEEIAEELADEAERGYDLSKARRVGRKSLTGGRGHSPSVHFRITAALQQQAQERAEREGKTVSQIARDALEHYIARTGKRS